MAFSLAGTSKHFQSRTPAGSEPGVGGVYAEGVQEGCRVRAKQVTDTNLKGTE